MESKKLVIEATPEAFNNLPHITQVQPVSVEDAALLVEIRRVLEKYNALNRFGLQLLHKHFDLRKGEILQEETDEESRVSTIKPALINDVVNRHNVESITYTTVFFPVDSKASPAGVVTLACAISCASHQYGKVHNVT